MSEYHLDWSSYDKRQLLLTWYQLVCVRSVTFNRTFENFDWNPLIRWNVTQHLNHHYCHTDERNMVDSCERGQRKSPGGSEGYPPLVLVKCKDAYIRCGTRGKVVTLRKNTNKWQWSDRDSRWRTVTSSFGRRHWQAVTTEWVRRGLARHS